jgi:hypothetical protein
MKTSTRAITASALLCVGLAASAQDFPMKEQAGVRWTCAGIGQTERAALAKLEPQSNLKLVFAGGKEGAYLARVGVSLTDAAGKKTKLQFTADGPICLIQAPAGSYRVDATYADSKRTASATLGKEAKHPATVVFHFPKEQ